MVSFIRIRQIHRRGLNLRKARKMAHFWSNLRIIRKCQNKRVAATLILISQVDLYLNRLVNRISKDFQVVEKYRLRSNQMGTISLSCN